MYIIKANYKDAAGAGFFVLNKDNTCSWGYSSDNAKFPTEAQATEHIATLEKPESWRVYEIKGE